MPLRRPNLLDAFRRMKDQPAPGAGGSPSVPTTGGAAGTPSPSVPRPGSPRAAAPESAPKRTPAAAPAERPLASAVVPPTPRTEAAAPTSSAALPTVPPASPRVAPPPPRIDPPAARPPAPPKERLLLLALGITVAVLVLVMMLRGDGTTPAAVQAGDGSAAIATPPAPIVAAPAPAAPTRAPHDAALYDAKNRYTVRLIQYPNDAKGVALATEAYRWLQKFGYPAGSPILLGSGKGIVLVASAKPTREELVPLRDNLRRLRYPESSKTMPFSDAYIDEIDDVLAR